MLFIVLGVALLCAAVWYKRRDDNGDAPNISRDALRQRATAFRKDLRSDDTLLRVAVSKFNRTDQAIIFAAILVAVVIAAVVGGLTPALIIAVAVSLCLLPLITMRVMAHRRLRNVLRSSRVADGEKLYVPSEWQHK